MPIGIIITEGDATIGEIMRTFTAVLYREEDMYIAECPEVGTVSQGRTVEEAVANLKEATELYLEEFVVSGQTGSHVRMSKATPGGKVGTAVPLHDELKIGTLPGVLKLAKIDPDDFARYL